MNLKKCIAVLISAVIFGGCVSFSAMNVENVSVAASASNGREVPATGKFGDNIVWNLDDNGTLTLSGTGKMYDYGDSNGETPFLYAQNVKNVIIENGITGIGKEAFYYCSSMESVSIPQSVERIDDKAFYGCTVLETVDSPENAESFGSLCFFGTRWIKNYFKDNDFLIINGYFLQKSTECKGDVVIPDGVKTICGRAFVCYAGESAGVTSVTMPDTVEEIGRGAFEGNSEIKSFRLSKNLKNIEPYAFNICKSLKKIDIPYGVKTIGDFAFWQCKNLKEINIPETVEDIGIAAFLETPWLENNDKVNDYFIVNDILLSLNLKVTNAEFPANVKKIDSVSLHGNVKTAKIPRRVTRIQEKTFYNTSLESIILTDAVKCIEEESFKYCDNLKTIYFYGNEESFKKIDIAGGNEEFTNAEVKYLKFGDVNEDSKVDSKDAVKVLKDYAESLVSGKSELDVMLADVNQDLKIDSKDAVLLLRYYAATLAGTFKGEISEFK